MDVPLTPGRDLWGASLGQGLGHGRGRAGAGQGRAGAAAEEPQHRRAAPAKSYAATRAFLLRDP